MDYNEIIKDCPLISAIEDEVNKQTVRFHMPGHKGQEFPFVNNRFDFTEYSQTDNLYCPEGAILRAEQKAALAFGSGATLFCAGGATLALQACVMYAKYLSDTTGRCVLVDRLCHKSVFNALMLCDIQPVWFLPDDENAVSVIQQLKPCVVIITDIDYYGKFRLSRELAMAVKQCGGVLICDNSHGTHLAFCQNGLHYPLTLGADISVDSAHKTTPALTGGAFINVSRETSASAEKIRKFMEVFGSSSPSYLIMQSLDWSRAYMQRFATQKLCELEKHIDNIRKLATDKGFCVFDKQTHDVFRLTIGTENVDISGNQLYSLLLENGIVCEMCDQTCVVLICTVCDDKQMYDKLYKCIESISCKKTRKKTDIISKPTIPNLAMPPKRALFSTNCQTVNLINAIGKISAEIYAPYPPGIPLIMPGEVFNNNVIEGLTPYYTEVKVIIQ